MKEFNRFTIQSTISNYAHSDSEELVDAVSDSKELVDAVSDPKSNSLVATHTSEIKFSTQIIGRQRNTSNHPRCHPSGSPSDHIWSFDMWRGFSWGKYGSL